MKYKIIYGGANLLDCNLVINKCIINNLYKYENFLDNILKYIDSEILQSNCKELGSSNILIDILQVYRASNDVYIIKVDESKTYIDELIFIDGNTDLAMKVCDMDNATCSIYILMELEILTKFSKLVINKITNSLLLFFGYTNSCNINIKDVSLKINIDESSIIFTNYINDSVQAKNTQFTERQLFEYIYTVICCLANYGFFIGDQHSENILCFQDSTGIIYKIKDDYFYFQELSTLCIIDYQSKYEVIPVNKQYNITNILNNIQSYCQKNETVLEKYTNQLRLGSIDELLLSLKENFNNVISPPRTDIKTFEFKIL